MKNDNNNRNYDHLWYTTPQILRNFAFKIQCSSKNNFEYARIQYPWLPLCSASQYPQLISDSHSVRFYNQLWWQNCTLVQGFIDSHFCTSLKSFRAFPSFTDLQFCISNQKNIRKFVCGRQRSAFPKNSKERSNGAAISVVYPRWCQSARARETFLSHIPESGRRTSGFAR